MQDPWIIIHGSCIKEGLMLKKVFVVLLFAFFLCVGLIEANDKDINEKQESTTVLKLNATSEINKKSEVKDVKEVKDVQKFQEVKEVKATQESQEVKAAREAIETRQKTEKKRKLTYKYDEIQQDGTFFSAVGLADLPNKTYKEALEEAKSNALKNLSQSIESRVEVVAKKYVDEIETGGEITNQNSFQELVKVYSEINFKYVKLLEEISNYKDQNVMAVMAYVNKKEYEAQTAKIIEDRILEIVQLIKPALAAKDKAMYVVAINDLLEASKKEKKYFNGGAAMWDIDNTGDKKSLNSVIVSSLNALIGGIAITKPDKKIVYDANGKMRSIVVVKVNYGDSPVGNLPLIAKFVSGSGSIDMDKIYTTDIGEARVNINQVNAENESCAVKVSVDLEKLGLPQDFASPPSVVVDLSRLRSFAYVVHGGGDFTDTLKTRISSMGYEPIKVTEDDFNNGVVNADYILVLSISASYQEGSEYGLNKGYAESKFEIYSLPDKIIITSVEGPSAEAVGRNRSEAKSRAVGRIQKRLYSLVNEELGKLK